MQMLCKLRLNLAMRVLNNNYNLFYAFYFFIYALNNYLFFKKKKIIYLVMSVLDSNPIK